MVIAEDPGEGNPVVEYGGSAMEAPQRHIMETPIALMLLPDQEQWGMAPVLASTWEYTDPKTLVLKLKEGIKFQNGEELTAEHVKAVYDDIIKSGKPVFRVSGLKPLGEAVVVDKYTVRFNMPAPAPLAVAGLEVMPIPALARGNMTEGEFGQHPVGTGPYKAIEYARNKPVRLEAWDAYRLGKPSAQRITVSSVPEPTTRAAVLLSGDAEIVQRVPLESIPSIVSNKNLEVVASKGTGVYVDQINVFKTPFKDARVRQAMNYAVDRSAILSQVLEGRGIVQTGPLVPGFLGYTEVQPYAYDPQRARALLKEAGYPDGFSFNWIITTGIAMRDAEIAQAMAKQLADVGIKANLVPTERVRIRAQRDQGDYDVIELLWSAAWVPANYLNLVLYGGLPDKVLEPKWGPPPSELVEARQIFAKASGAATIQDTEAGFAELHKFMRDQAFYLFTFANDELWGVQKSIGWRPYPASRMVSYYDYWTMIGKKTPTGTDIPLVMKLTSK